MGKLQQQLQTLSPADAARELLSSCEKNLARLNNANAAELLTDAEDAERALAELERGGADTRSERTRLDAISGRIGKHAHALIRLLGGTKNFVALRNTIAPGSSSVRWQLDKQVAQAQRKLFWELGAIAAAFVLIGLVGYAFRGVLFPPDPVGDAIHLAQQALEQRDIKRASQEVSAGIALTPSNASLLIWQAILSDTQNIASAQTQFAQLQTRLSPFEFLLERAQIYISLNEFQKALTDMNTLIAREPERPEAYYVRATAHEMLRQRELAVQDINTCAALAEAQGNSQLYATARVRLGSLLQQQP